MLQKNLKFVLKNYMLQEAIETVQEGDFSVVGILFRSHRIPIKSMNST